MIYTLTLNPALDYILSVPSFTQGQVNRSSREEIQAGGKGINVSVILNRLGVDNIALGCVAGFTGTEICRILEDDGIKTDFIHLPSGNSRINVKLKTDNETEVNAKGPIIDNESLSNLFDKLKNLTTADYLVLSGSPGNGLTTDIYRNIIELVKAKSVKVILDAEGDALLSALGEKPFLIKPNHYELGQILNKKIETHIQAIEGAKELQAMGAQNVIISMAELGAVMVTQEGQSFTMSAPKGCVINSTGAGDSLVGGFLAEFSRSNDYYKAFKLGICSGSATAFSMGLAEKKYIYEILKQF